MRRQNYIVIDGQRNSNSDIERWLWAFHDTRQRTIEELENLPHEVVDWQPPDHSSSIGDILYHIALIEADWLYAEVLEQPHPPDVVALFPHEDRDEHGQLVHIQGVALADHLARLAAIRERVVAVFRHMDVDDFRRIRTLPYYDVTPEWVLHHLMQHEAEHRSQIGALRQAAQQAHS